jgi:hypothetical protein
MLPPAPVIPTIEVATGLGIMKKLALITLGLAAAAVSAAGLAETATVPPAPTEAATGKAALPKLKAKQKNTLRGWSLKPTDANQAKMVGPAVPAPQRVRLPQKKSPQKRTAVASGGIKPVNATPIVRQIVQRNQNNNTNN